MAPSSSKVVTWDHVDEAAVFDHSPARDSMASASKPAANGTTYGSTLRGCVVGVTGGAGHIGQRLRSRLLAVGCAEVRSLDVHHSASALSLGGGKRDVCIDGSVTDAQACRQLANGVDVVFHLAAAGMSGPAMLDAGLTNRVNVGGTFTLLDQCSQVGGGALSFEPAATCSGDPRPFVRFVYCSTANVVFGGQTIDGGDETTPVFPADQHMDRYVLAHYGVCHLPDATGASPSFSLLLSYSQSKAAAEAMVLEANAQAPSPRATLLYTTALRPNAIYSEHDERHFPRIANLAPFGATRVPVGRADAKLDWLYVENFVDALLAAAESLHPSKGKRAAGRVYVLVVCAWQGSHGCSWRVALPLSRLLLLGCRYCVGDGTPINMYDLFRRLDAAVTGRSPNRPPLFRVPVSLAMGWAHVCEAVHRATGYLPGVTRAEVAKASAHHWFHITRARKELGWTPRVSWEEGMGRVVAR